HLRTALQERDLTCVVPGCEVAHGLEIDHWRVDYAEGGPTCLDNLARLCHAHHLAKTHRGYVLAGGPRHWTWSHPVGPLAPPGPPGHDQLPME
ncbi:MAG: HNH endonuclease signature motif containing protein, partial [Acidimicrobiales bacterium]